MPTSSINTAKINRKDSNGITQKENINRFLFNGKEVLILVGVSVFLTSAFMCCVNSFIQHGFCEKKSRRNNDFKIDRWWASQSTSGILSHLLRNKPASSEESASCKWSRSSKQRSNSKIVCQCNSTNSSKSIAF
ncbi:uncharacterized protein CEXT_525311 [Caerostris extrusa]|uniref:Uncharacterized protein n=1 Tax=Caerostris extrusa TaxID=172846 RepID=A0AAV4MMN2_CAEEX|nr:uncharacterized protein CEXT_525311 [Caerostris extrusa]